MTPFEFLVTLISVLVGLAVADLATSVHRLLRARHRVRWDWLPMVAALLAVLAVLEFWWQFFEANQDPGPYLRLVGFLPLAAQLLLLFLLNAAALPDHVPDEGLDLRTFYEHNRRYFWSLYALYVALVMIARVVGWALLDDPPPVGWLTRSLLPNTVVVASFVALILSGRRWLHALVMLLWLLVFMASWWGLRLEP